MSEKLWDGRFSEKTSRSVERFTSSIDIDSRLYPYDIEGSIAHCKTLARAGIISDDEAATLVQGLGVVKREIDRGDFLFDDALEDIHMHIETRLLQEVGKVAQKLHTARSRNDQVVLDVRMFLLDMTRQMISRMALLRGTLVKMASIHIDVIMPGYTHLQHAQPVLFSHHLMAYYEMFKRDGERFQDALGRIDVMPLGSAALAGTTYPIDRHFTAELLGFSRVSPNSMDAVSDRDFILEFLANASICMVHFSRLSEEIILWSSSEFTFIEMPDAFATGSSIMPQKKNPDVPELVRGKTGGVFGDLLAVLTLMKSLPLAYNRDMQEDKLPLFRSVDTLSDCIDIYIQMLPKIHINKERMLQAASVGFLNATDLADYLVVKGMTFREAHGCVGKAVGFAIDQEKELNELSLKELKTFSSLIESDVYSYLAMDQMIERRTSFGGTAKQNVIEEIAKAEGEKSA
ncbi:MAG: argininosuccinate lyase [Desulfobacterales bacterium]|nr:argininosuccinate lyase [Desulfobacterales bacterium]MDX2512030.1 argininosuccinate lyase [Desulfobacterales bacterium]